MRTRAIIFEGKPGSGPEQEQNPQPFGPETLDTAAAELAAQVRANTAAAAPQRRKPGRPRKNVQ